VLKLIGFAYKIEEMSIKSITEKEIKNLFSSFAPKTETKNEPSLSFLTQSAVAFHKHTSIHYGMEFTSNVPLFQKIYVSQVTESLEMHKMPK
jgi:hypothetical protein